MEEKPKNICVICPTCKECVYEGEEMDKDWQAIFQERHCNKGDCHIEQPIVIEAKDLKGYDEESVKMIPIKRRPLEDESKYKKCYQCKQKKLVPDKRFKGSWRCEFCGHWEYNKK